MKTLTLWLVLMTPTPECVSNDIKQNVVQFVLPDGRQVTMRLPEAPPAPQAQTLTFTQEEEPEINDQGCYDAWMGKVAAKTVAVVNQATRDKRALKALEANVAAAKLAAKEAKKSAAAKK